MAKQFISFVVDDNRGVLTITIDGFDYTFEIDKQGS